MRCKIVRFQKLMWRNMMRSTKSQKASVLYYSIDKLAFLQIIHVRNMFGSYLEVRTSIMKQEVK
jgi:hypothetical protein